MQGTGTSPGGIPETLGRKSGDEGVPSRPAKSLLVPE
jgi:hypothetical protein